VSGDAIPVVIDGSGAVEYLRPDTMVVWPIWNRPTCRLDWLGGQPAVSNPFEDPIALLDGRLARFEGSQNEARRLRGEVERLRASRAADAEHYASACATDEANHARAEEATSMLAEARAEIGRLIAEIDSVRRERDDWASLARLYQDDVYPRVARGRDAVSPREIRDSGVSRIALERRRQVTREGWSAAHDDAHAAGELAWAAACYAAPRPIFEGRLSGSFADPWPWGEWDKRPGPDAGSEERVRTLEKAGALVAAEIDRLLRVRAADAGTCPGCGSPERARHPAVQHGGESCLCTDPWHSRRSGSGEP